eukprot:CAMPEP_0170386388 /NCGR_PEP_ID=MMETSP0117_2-20130122/17008_1 /TAXON_ID=400756 /ORGANISM="Durinskia baltica, Strain CSIRO CS-38" /LENGTH=472 /DNA_ID=CAMNT_0010642207 /DNA_START=298 /DNA_END=1716 /DNA_ORIENTATION=+
MTNYDIACFMSTSKKMFKEISSDAIWEQLWLQTYGAMWQHPAIRKIREGRGIYWDPLLNYGPPQQGWHRFFLLFEVSYLDWILAGHCTESCCLVGINDCIVDVSSFIDLHPGSRETLTEGAGCDATETFKEIGHSTHAEQLVRQFTIWDRNEQNTPVCLCSNAHLQEDMCGHCLQSNRTDIARKRHVLAEFTKQVRRFPVKTKLHEHMKLNQKKVTELMSSKHKEAASNAMSAEAGGGEGGGHFEGFSAVIPLIETAAAAVSSNVSAVVGNATGGGGGVANTNAPTVALLPGEDLNDYDDDSDSADTESISTSGGSSVSSGVYSDEVGDDFIDTDGIPDVSESFPSFPSPARALTSILDKIKREYRKGSLQLRGASYTSTTRAAAGEDRVESEDEYVPPIASYFGPSQVLVSSLGGFEPCMLPQDHMGQPKAYFDPFTEEWTAWWSCCGQGQVLVEAPMPPSEGMGDAIFCK